LRKNFSAKTQIFAEILLKPTSNLNFMALFFGLKYYSYFGLKIAIFLFFGNENDFE